MDQIEQQKRQAYRRVYSRVRHFKETFESEDGAKVLLELMRYSNFLTSCYNDNPYKQSYNNGMRDLVGWIMQQMKINEKEVHRLIEESERNATRESSST